MALRVATGREAKILEMNIRGYYKGNDTGDYMIDQLSNGTIYWIGEAPDGSWTNIFWGKVQWKTDNRGFLMMFLKAISMEKEP